MNPLWMILGMLLLISIVGAASTHNENSKRCFYQQWYHDACKKFGEDYTYPTSTCRNIMQADGTIIREETHYRPVRYSTSTYFDKRTKWFLETLRVDGGRDQFIERKFYNDRQTSI